MQIPRPWKKPEVTTPHNCAGNFSLGIDDAFNQSRLIHVEVITATVACPGLPGVVTLAQGEVRSPSGRERRKARAAIAQEAGQQAVLTCATCPLSTLVAERKAQQAALLAQAEADRLAALESIAKQREVAEALEELRRIGQPDARELFPPEGPASPPALPPGSEQI